jgi:putative toxin-antitoxin system antitoxin component (TIGR02293 family)
MTIVAAERAAEYLGIEVKKTPLAWLEAVEKGLPVARLESFAKRIAPGNAQFKYHIVKKATYARRKEAKPARLSKEESEVLLRIAQVFAFAEDVWGGADQASLSCRPPTPSLKAKRLSTLRCAAKLGRVSSRISWAGSPTARPRDCANP